MEGHPLANSKIPFWKSLVSLIFRSGGPGSQGRLFPFPRSEGTRGKSQGSPTRVQIETLEDRTTPAISFWSDLDPSVGGSPKALISADFNGDGKLDVAAASLDSVTVALGNGQGKFGPAQLLSLSSTPRALVAGDFSGDGKLDIATVNALGEGVSLLVGKGDGSFAAPTTLNIGVLPYGVAAGDFNADGKLDLATANYGSDSVTVALGNGNGTFQTPTNLGVGSFPSSLTVADINGDGKADLATANNNGSTVSLLIGNGNGTFRAATTANVGQAPLSIIWADLNKDGKTDLATANDSGNSVSILIGNGNGTFKTAATVIVGQGPQVVAATDLNQDGKVDLVTANVFDNGLSLVMGNGDGTFRSATSLPVGNGPQGLVAGDFNNDTKVDLIAANTSDSTLSVILGNGNGTFSTSQVLPTGGNPSGIVVADFNGDGRDDWATSNQGGGGVSVLLGLSQGGFGPATVWETGLNPLGIVSGDFNKDGKRDLATANFGGNTLSILLGNGNGTFQPQILVPTGLNPHGIDAGDINGDGNVDLAVTLNGDNQIAFFLGKGNGTFQAGAKITAGAGPQTLLLNDYNRDGKLDFAAINTGESTLLVMMGNGDGTFQARNTYVVGVNPYDLAQGDLNGDGWVDLVCVNSGENTISVLPGLGDGTFGWGVPYQVGSTPLAVRLADFNRDGRLDIITADSGSNSATLLLGQLGGGFLPSISFGVSNNPGEIAVGDFNGDGSPDAVVSTSDGKLFGMLGNGDGQFRTGSSLGVGNNPSHVAQGDLNGDGRADLIAVNSNGASVTVLLAQAGGGFAPGKDFNVGLFPQSVAVADFNGDGKADLVTTNNAEDTISLLIGNGDGSFRDATSLATGYSPLAVLTGDFNGDKRSDFVVSNTGDGTVSLFLGNGNGTFRSAKTASVGVIPQSLAAADFNGDGRLDLVTANAGGNNVSFLAGNGDGSFRNKVDFPAGQTPYGIATADFNKDGKSDLVVTNAGENSVSLLLGNGNGTFRTSHTLPVGDSPFSVAVGDFNKDGSMDVATANSGANQVSLLLGNGDGTFLAGGNLTAGGNPYSIVAGDWNGDGAQDLATANYMSNTVSVFRGADPIAPTITSPAQVTVTAGKTTPFSLTATGTPAPGFSVVSGTLPQGLTLNPSTGKLEGTAANGTTGIYNLVIAASNGIGSPATQSFQLTVNEELAFVSPDQASFVYGNSVAFTFKASGFPAPTFSVTGGSLPAGLSLNSTTGVLSGKANAGTYTFRVAAANGKDPAVSQDFTLTISRATLVIRAEDKTKVYGAAMPGLTATYTGLVNGDTASVVTGLVLSSTGSALSGVGTYPISATGAVATNYAISFEGGSLTVTPASLTITPDPKSMVYGGAIPTLTATYAGLVNGDNFQVVKGLVLSSTAPDRPGAGTYSITAQGGSAPNYTITYGPSANLLVAKAQLSVTAVNKSKVYGAPLPDLEATFSGLVNGDDITDMTGMRLSTTALASSKVGAYPITVSGITNPNYNITYVPGSLEVTRANLTITAEARQKTYGAALPTLTVTYSGLVNGDTAQSIQGLSLATTATTTSPVGTYPITVSGGISENYTIQRVGGLLTVTRANLTIVPDAKVKTYGAALPALTASISGLVAGDTPSVLSNLVLTTTATAASPVGTYAIGFQGTPTAANYTITLGPEATLTVARASLTITADNQSIGYGQAIPNLTARFVGLVNGDTPASISGLSLSTPAKNNSPNGVYPIQVSGGSNPNYTIVRVDGTLTINKANLVVTVLPAVKKYGEALPRFEAQITGFLDGDDASLVSGLTFQTTATSKSDVGSYTIVAANASAANYGFVYVPGTLSVEPADLLVRPAPVTRVYGSANPQPQLIVEGLVPGDSPSVLDGFQWSTPATDRSPVGTYPITIESAQAKNYRVTITGQSTLEVTPTTLTVRPNPVQVVYGQAVPALSATITGFVLGEDASLVSGLKLETDAKSGSGVGSYPIRAFGALAANYSVRYLESSVTVAPATLTITATNQVATYGDPLPGFSVEYAGFVAGDGPGQVSNLQITTLATQGSPIGVYEIAPRGAQSPNYTIAYETGRLTIQKAKLTIKAQDATAVYGQSPDPFQASFVGLVAGDQPDVVKGLVLTTGARIDSPVGSYPITGTGASAQNYDISYVPGNLAINPGSLIVEPVSVVKPYGDPLPTLQARFSGLTPWDTPAVVQGLELVSNAQRESPVGTYTIVARGGSAANYLIQYANPATLTVQPAALRIQAVPQSMTYGDAVPNLEVVLSGLAPWDNGESIGLGQAGTTATSQSPVGSYPITLPRISPANYTVTYADAVLSIHPAPLTLKARDAQKLYGAGLPRLEVDLIGLKNGDSPESVTGWTIATPATMQSGVGSYPITVQGGSAQNYQIQTESGELVIQPAPLLIKAEDKIKPFGSPIPLLTASYHGLVLNEDPAVVRGLILSTPAQAQSPAGDYPIVPGGAQAPNYAITYENGTLTIDRSLEFLGPDRLELVYGQSGALELQTSAPATFSKAGSWPAGIGLDPTTGQISVSPGTPAGTYPLMVIATSGTGGAEAARQHTIVINRAALVIKALDQSRTYGSPNPALAYSFNGLVNGDGPGVVSDLIVTTPATTQSPVGSYPVVLNGARAQNYEITLVPGTLSVQPASLVIRAENGTRTYGATNPTFQVRFEGLVAGDTSAVVENLALQTSAQSNSPVGTYPIEPSGARASNYTIRYVPGTLLVEKAALVIRADNKIKRLGQANPTLSATVSGLVGSDTQEVVKGLVLSTTALSNSPTGEYPIRASQATADNYTITYAEGVLSVVAAPTIVSSPNVTFTYGKVDSFDIKTNGYPASQFRLVQGSLPSGFLLDPTSGKLQTSGLAPAGVYRFTVGASNGVGGEATQNLTITIAKATLLVVPDAVSRVYGTLNPAITARYIGLVNGDTASLISGLKFATPASQTSKVGTYPITASGATALNYTIQYQASTLTVVPATLVVTPVSANRTYGTANPAFRATFVGLVNGDKADLIRGLKLTTQASPSSSVGTYSITASGASAENYTIQYQPGTLRVTPASLVITPAPATKVYGAPLPTFGATFKGLVNGDTQAVVQGLKLTTSALANSPVGTYPLTATGATAGNYTISYAVGTLTVTKANLLIIPQNKTKVYGAPLPGLTVQYQGLTNGDTPSAIKGLVLATTAKSSSPVGSYPITASGATSPNYTITYGKGSLAITRAELTIRAQDASRTYGAANPTFATTITGLVNGDKASVIQGLAWSTTARPASPVGSYPITTPSVSAANYSIKVIGGTLTVTPAVLTISAEPKTKVYGAALPSLTASITGLVNGEKATLVRGLQVRTVATSQSPVGTYAIEALGATAPNYTIVYKTSLMTVNPAPLTIRPNLLSRVYGEENPPLTISLTGLVNGDTPSVVTGTLIATTANRTSPVGVYPITVSGSVSPNYTINHQPGTLTITRANLVVSANNLNKPLGAALPSLTVQYQGWKNQDGPSHLTGLRVQTQAGASSPVGTYSIVPSGATNPNYTISFVPGVLTVGTAPTLTQAKPLNLVYGQGATQTVRASGSSGISYTLRDAPNGVSLDPLTGAVTIAPGTPAGLYTLTLEAKNAFGTASQKWDVKIAKARLTVAPNPQTRTYGQPNSELSTTVKGLVAGDSAEVIQGLSVLTSAVPTSAVGQYPIWIEGASASNYDIELVPGTLTIKPAPLTLRAEDQVVTYGQPLPQGTIQVQGLVAGDTLSSLQNLRVVSPAQPQSGVGRYSLEVVLDENPNYEIHKVSGTLTIQPASLRIEAISLSKVYGQSLPTLQARFTGLAPWDNADSLSGLVLETTAQSTSGVGNYPIVVKVGQNSNYQIETVPGWLTVQPAPLTIKADSQIRLVGTSNPTLTATFEGLVNGDRPEIIRGLRLETNAQNTSRMGRYPITASGAKSENYTIRYETGVLTVGNPVSITSPTKMESTYGQFTRFQVTTTGFPEPSFRLVAGTMPSGLSLDSQTGLIEATDKLQAGEYVLKIGARNGLGQEAVTDLIWTVNKADLVIRANPVNRVYGSSNPQLTATMTGLVAGDTPSAITGLVLNTTATASSPVGVYPITLTANPSSNYTLRFEPASLTITRAPLTIRPHPITRTYGMDNPRLTASFIGLVNQDSSSVVTGLVLSTPATKLSNAGSYTISASGANAANYDIRFETATLTVEKAVLQVIVDAATRNQGEPNPPFTVTLVGLIKGDDPKVLQDVQFRTEATPQSAPGVYLVHPMARDTANYRLILIPGRLTILENG